MTLEKNYTQGTKDLIKRAEKTAQTYGHTEVDEIHVETAALEHFRDYLADLESGVKTYDSGSSSLPFFFSDVSTNKILKETEERNKVKPIIDLELKDLHKTLTETAEKTPPAKVTSLPISERLIDGVYDMFTASLSETQTNTYPVDESMFLDSIYSSNEALDKNRFRQFCTKMADSVMRDSRPQEEKIHLSAYYEKAKNVFGNLSRGTNMFVTHDIKTNPMLFVDSFVHLFNAGDSGIKDSFKSDTTISVFNDQMRSEFLIDKIREAAKDKNKKHIFIFNQDWMLSNVVRTASDENLTGGTLLFNEAYLNFMKEPPKNIKFVIVQNRNSYLPFMSHGGLQNIFANFGEVSIPVLSNEQAKKAFKEQPNLMNKIEVPFSKKAIDSVIDSVTFLDGNYPEKAQRIMKLIASYHVGRKEVSAADVKQYVEEAKDLFKPNEDNSSVEIVFDTELRLKDLLGKDATKKEAESIVRQIKQKHLGTKGAIIYSQDGSVGSGRKYTAKVIAGETKSPYVEINALDFGTEEVDLFGGASLSPEKSINKLFSLVNKSTA